MLLWKMGKPCVWICPCKPVEKNMKHWLIVFFFFRYLDKQAFLERADIRQFEIERAMRQSKRSNRWNFNAGVRQALQLVLGHCIISQSLSILCARYMKSISFVYLPKGRRVWLSDSGIISVMFYIILFELKKVLWRPYSYVFCVGTTWLKEDAVWWFVMWEVHFFFFLSFLTKEAGICISKLHCVWSEEIKGIHAGHRVCNC